MAAVVPVSDWRENTSSLINRSKHLFYSKELADCLFVIDSQQIWCHKLVLAMGSPVFQAMFYGEMAPNLSPVKILDIEYNVFMQLLRYLYCDELELKNCKNACDIYNAAKKYLVYPLVKDCLSYLHQKLQIEWIIPVYQFAKFHNEISLEKHCLKEMQLNTANILLSESFCEASLETVSIILDFSCLNIDSEVELVRAITRWAESERLRQGIQEVNICSVTGDLIKKLRLMTLTPDEFIENMAGTFLLTEKEKFYILSRIIRPDLPLIPEEESGLSNNKEKRRPCRSKCFLRLEVEDVSNSRCDGSEWLTSTFTTNSRITLLGVELSLQANPAGGEYIENLMVKLGEANKSEHFAGGSHYGLVHYNRKIQIMFSAKSVLEPKKEYAIHTFLCIPGMYPIGKNVKQTFISPGNIIIDFLSHSSWERSHPWNTTVLTGIIYTDPLD